MLDRAGLVARRLPLRAAAAAVLMLAVALVVIPFFPGHLSADILWMADQAKTGVISDQHAPVLVWLWSLVWPLGVGVGAVFLLQVAALVAGLYWILRAIFSRLQAAAVALVIVVVPPVYGMLAWVVRDVWFTSALLLATGFAIRAQRANGRAHAAWLVAASLAALVCVLTRQNAFVAILVVAGGTAWVELARTPGARARLRRGFVAAGIAVVTVICMLGVQRAASAAIDPVPAHAEGFFMVYDVGSMSLAAGTDLFPRSINPRQDLRQIREVYSADDMVPLMYSPSAPLVGGFTADDSADLRGAWIRAVLDRPGTYLRVRTELFARQLGMVDGPVWVMHPGVDDNNQGLGPVFPGLDSAASAYARSLVGGSLRGSNAIYWPWPYLAVCVVGALFFGLGRLRASSGLRIVGAFAAALVVYALGLAVLAPAAQFRFMFPVVVGGMATLAVLGRYLWVERCAFS